MAYETVEMLMKRTERLEQQRSELLEALKVAHAFMEHCWQDVQLNEYSLDKLNGAIGFVDEAITKAEAAE